MKKRATVPGVLGTGVRKLWGWGKKDGLHDAEKKKSDCYRSFKKKVLKKKVEGGRLLQLHRGRLVLGGGKRDGMTNGLIETDLRFKRIAKYSGVEEEKGGWIYVEMGLEKKERDQCWLQLVRRRGHLKT